MTKQKAERSLTGGLGVLFAVVACGGRSEEPGTGSGDDNPADGGVSGDVDSGGSTGGSNDADGGDDSGGTSAAGGDSASGGGDGDGTGGDENVVTAVTLGEPCDSPGTFACADNNPKLALICGGDGEWEARETCSGEDVCDPNDGSGLGTCRTAYAECAMSEGIMCTDDNRVVECTEGGFELRVIEECGGGTQCEGAECVVADDPCHQDQTYNCSSDCEQVETNCSSDASCENFQWSNSLLEEGPTIVRIPNEGLCSACDRPFFNLQLHPNTFPTTAVKFTIGAGWGLIASDGDGNLDECGDPVLGCVVVPPLDFGTGPRNVYAIPLTDEAFVRNVTIEPVEPGATCDSGTE